MEMVVEYIDGNVLTVTGSSCQVSCPIAIIHASGVDFCLVITEDETLVAGEVDGVTDKRVTVTNHCILH